MQRKAHWRFAPTGGGAEHGNSAGQEYFKDDAVKQMVRETIQNSLDQHQDGLEGVKMTYRLTRISPEDIGADSLKKHVQASYEEARSRKDPATTGQYERMLHVLDNSTLDCLAVADANTLGLREENWDNLIIKEGVPAINEQGQAHGGSFGFGKNAPFNLSQTKTVMYSTRYVARAAKGKVTRMMGRSQLRTHDDPKNGERLQSVGFYAVHDETGNNRPVSGPDIPEPFHLDESGTGIFIIAFDSWRYQDWMTQVETAVVTNFFAAVHERKLEVEIVNEHTGEKRAVNQGNLELLITELPKEDSTKHYFKALQEEPFVTNPRNQRTGLFQQETPRVKRLELRVNTDREATRRLAHVNRRGMLITDKGLRGGNPLSPYAGGQWSPWNAVTVAADEDTEMAIRSMEPPTHNAILPGRLADPEKRRMAEDDLAHHREQIRKFITDRIDQRLNEQASNVTELAELFPGVPWEKDGTDHEVTKRATGEGNDNILEIERDNGEEDTEEDNPEDPRNAGIPRDPQPKGERPDAPPPAAMHLRDARILRSSPDTLEIRSSPPRAREEPSGSASGPPESNTRGTKRK